jgi:hypothetical protein
VTRRDSRGAGCGGAGVENGCLVARNRGLPVREI